MSQHNSEKESWAIEEMNVLVVEDSTSTRKLVAASVRAAGHAVFEARDGLEAVDAFKNSESIDLIVMDAEMPNMNGFEATKTIREYTQSDWVPIVFLSAHNRDDYIQRALDTGADVYLKKPISVAQVLGQINALERIIEMKSKLDMVNRELQDANQALKQMARLDGLTQIPNRRTFDERIEIEVARSSNATTPLSLMMCDIDCFKQFNDSFGHLAGDTTLKRVAKAIESSLDHDTDLVARYGGEEFVVVLPDTPIHSAFKVANRMIKAIANLGIRHDPALAPVDRVSISIGVACAAGQTPMTPNELIEKADKALYQAKETGRNRAVMSTCETVSITHK